MDSIIAIAIGLGLRFVIGIVSGHNVRIVATLVGLWEGFTLFHFVEKMPDSPDPYIGFGARLFIDFLITENISRLTLVLLWAGIGAMFADIAPDVWHGTGLKHFYRRQKSSFSLGRGMHLPGFSSQTSNMNANTGAGLRTRTGIAGYGSRAPSTVPPSQGSRGAVPPRGGRRSSGASRTSNSGSWFVRAAAALGLGAIIAGAAGANTRRHGSSHSSIHTHPPPTLSAPTPAEQDTSHPHQDDDLEYLSEHESPQHQAVGNTSRSRNVLHRQRREPSPPKQPSWWATLAVGILGVAGAMLIDAIQDFVSPHDDHHAQPEHIDSSHTDGPPPSYPGNHSDFPRPHTPPDVLRSPLVEALSNFQFESPVSPRSSHITHDQPHSVPPVHVEATHPPTHEPHEHHDHSTLEVAAPLAAVALASGAVLAGSALAGRSSEKHEKRSRRPTPRIDTIPSIPDGPDSAEPHAHPPQSIPLPESRIESMVDTSSQQDIITRDPAPRYTLLFGPDKGGYSDVKHELKDETIVESPTEELPPPTDTPPEMITHEEVLAAVQASETFNPGQSMETFHTNVTTVTESPVPLAQLPEIPTPATEAPEAGPSKVNEEFPEPAQDDPPPPFEDPTGDFEIVHSLEAEPEGESVAEADVPPSRGDLSPTQSDILNAHRPETVLARAEFLRKVADAKKAELERLQKQYDKVRNKSSKEALVTKGKIDEVEKSLQKLNERAARRFLHANNPIDSDLTRMSVSASTAEETAYKAISERIATIIMEQGDDDATALRVTLEKSSKKNANIASKRSRIMNLIKQDKFSVAVDEQDEDTLKIDF